MPHSRILLHFFVVILKNVLRHFCDIFSDAMCSQCLSQISLKYIKRYPVRYFLIWQKEILGEMVNFNMINLQKVNLSAKEPNGQQNSLPKSQLKQCYLKILNEANGQQVQCNDKIDINMTLFFTFFINERHS
jgi:hypothetical protein